MTIIKHCIKNMNTIYIVSIYQQRCVCCRLLCTEQPSNHSYHKSNKNNAIPPPVLFLSNTDCYTVLQCLQNGSSCSGFLKKLCTPSFFIICMLHATYILSFFYDYVNNIWWTVTHMKLTTQSSAPLYSYLPLTSNIPLTTCPYKPSISVPLLM